MADINNVTLVSSGSPDVNYLITYSKNRPNNNQMAYTFTVSTSLGSSASRLGTGHTLDATITVNGVSANFQIKSRDESWSGNSVQSTDTVTVTCSSTSGNEEQVVNFYVNNTYGNAGKINNSSYTVSSIALTYTNCGAPSSFSINKTQAIPGDTAVLSWSGASGGTANDIQRYYIEYITNSMTSWVATDPFNVYTNSGSGNVTINLPDRQGETLRFRIRTEGSAGINYYSGWKEATNTCTLYSVPSMGACSVSQSFGTFTITWPEGNGGVNNPISGYRIFMSYRAGTSGNWSSGTTIATVDSSVRSYQWSGGTVGYYYRFTVHALGQNWGSGSYGIWSTAYQKERPHAACGAPSNLKSNNINPVIGETITLSWDPGSAGDNNSVIGYELSYSTNMGSTYYIISSGIGASTTSYNYIVPRTPGEIRFRVRTRGSAGSAYYSPYNYSTNYQTIIIKQADPPTSGTVTASLIDHGDSGDKAFNITWSGFNGNTYNPISGYSLYYQTSKTIDDSDFGSLILLKDDFDASTTSYVYTGGIWYNYYKFVVKAKGQYYGESAYAYSTAVQKITDASTPPTAFEYSGSAFSEANNQQYVVAGLKISVMPIGAANAESYRVQYREVKQGIETARRTISDLLIVDQYSPLIKISEDLTDGDYVNFRAAARNVAGALSEYFPADSELDEYKIDIKTFKAENSLHPIIQIKRAHTDTWERENNSEDGIRISDGEFAYDTEKRILKIGNSITGTPQKYSELSNLFGLLEIGTNNKINSINSAAIGINNYCQEMKGYAVVNVDIAENLITLSSVEELEIGQLVTISNSGNWFSTTITNIDSENYTISINPPLSSYSDEGGRHDTVNGALWIETDPEKGDITISSPSGLVIGESNNNGGFRNLIVGSSNATASPSIVFSVARDSIISGRSNTLRQGGSNIISGSNNTINQSSNSLISGSYNNITGGSQNIIVGIYNNNAGNYNLIGAYLEGGGADYGLTIGKYNEVIEDSIFSIGVGTADNSRKNALYILNNRITTSVPARFDSYTYYNNTYSSYMNSDGSNAGSIRASTINNTNTLSFTVTNQFSFSNSGQIQGGLLVGSLTTQAIKSTIDFDYNIGVGALNSVVGRATAVFGQENTASDNWQYIMGYHNIARNQFQVLLGTGLMGAYDVTDQVIVGKYNNPNSGTFIVGGGASGAYLGNAFRTMGLDCYSNSGVSSGGADYAEYFEWEDGNPNQEDRIGHFVTHVGEKIKIASSNDFVIGAVSAAAAVKGNNPEEWNNRFLKDIYGRKITKKTLIPDEYIDCPIEKENEDGKIIIENQKVLLKESHYEDIPILNPEYDETQKYIERDKRAEWCCIGLVGKLVVNDDGTCLPDSFCKCNDEGIATKSIEQTRFRVLERLDDSHIKILIL